jgi:hypothetical protein
VLLTAVGDEYWPGGSTTSENWPGVAPGSTGVNNAMSPRWCETSGFGEVASPVPVLWGRGDEDQVVSDESMFDFGQLGKIGAVPGWPGDSVFPPQPQVSQTRAVFSKRPSVREVVLQGVGHGPLVERATEVARLMVQHIDAVKPATLG